MLASDNIVLQSTVELRQVEDTWPVTIGTLCMMRVYSGAQPQVLIKLAPRRRVTTFTNELWLIRAFAVSPPRRFARAPGSFAPWPVQGLMCDNQLKARRRCVNGWKRCERPVMFEVTSLLFGESSKVRGRIGQGANKPGGESSRGRNGKGAKKPDTPAWRPVNYCSTLPASCSYFTCSQ